MWSRIVLCLLVSFVFASNGNQQSPAWNYNSKYLYEVRARSVVSLDQTTNDYSGFLIKAVIEISPRSDGNLDGRILNPKSAPIHGPLRESWRQYIPDSDVSFQPIPISPEPFQIELNKNVVRNIIVSKKINNWEANVIKSFVSQFQLDLEAQNIIPSPFNSPPQEQIDTATFKTMEPTVTGVSETLYELHDLPRLIVEAQPWLINDKYVQNGDEYIEVIKTKNFTHSKVVPSYHFGLDGLRHYEPANKVGNFLSRSSVSTVVVTGSLQNYTVQSSVTLEEIFATPTLSGNQKGSVHTLVNVTLQEIVQEPHNDNNVVSPVEIGVVYGYDSPFAADNHPRPHKPIQVLDESSENSASYESKFERKLKIKRSISNSAPVNDVYQSSKSSEASPSSYEGSSQSAEHFSENPDWFQDQPSLEQPPSTPLLPLFVGYNGQSIKKQQNVVNIVRKLAQKIAQEFENPRRILEESTVREFVELSSFIRVMNLAEIQQVASQLYTKEVEGPKAVAWIAFYSAVAQAGTGPGLSAVIDFIQSGKIVELQAAEAISTTADSARQPTPQYMEAFFQLLQNDKFMQQRSLNESLVLSFSTLVHQVYVNRQVSHNKYPVHVFGSFRTQNGKNFVQSKVIPFLAKKLSYAYEQHNTHQIHVYIRALGNIGDRRILNVFEPYLENEKAASAVQRVHMILSLTYLAKTYPEEVRAIVYKIAQNPTEDEEVRVAGVYQLMSTNPSPVMLQRMAIYTQVDNAHYVNSAVKSAIVSASELEGPEFAQLRAAAQSARPLLTNREYGLQYSQLYLRSFVSKMYEQESYKQTTVLFGGQDNAIARGLLYSLKANFGGVHQQFVTVRVLASSIDDLFVAFKQRTKKHQEHLGAKQEGQPEKQAWSSEYVANLLHMKNQPREQMESFLVFKMSAMQKLFSIDNQTVGELVQLSQKFEQELKQGQVYRYRSMKVIKEVVFAVPTSLGLPFVYTFDVPVLVRAQAKVQARASPQVIQDGVIHKPNTVNADVDVDAIVSARLQSRLTIFTTFDSQKYTAGYDKNLQFEIPLSGQIEINLQSKQIRASISNPGHEQNTQLAHYSNIPFTAKNPIYTPNQVVKIIQGEQMNRIFYNFGRESTGIAFNVEVNSEQIINLAYIWEKVSKYDLITDMLGSWIDENIGFTNISFGISASRSFTKTVVLEMGYNSTQTSNESQNQKGPINQSNEIPEVEDDPLKRKQQFIEKASAGINNVRVVVVDGQVQFVGERQMQYQATAALAKSDVDPNGRFIAFVEKNVQDQPNTQAYVDAVAKFPNTDVLDLKHAMEMNPQSAVSIRAFVRRNQKTSKIESHIQLRKNADRVKYLENQPNYRKYLQNRHLPLSVIAGMIAEANILNEFSGSVDYKNLDPEIMQASYKAYSYFRYFFFTRIFEKLFTGRNEQNIKIQGQFSPDLSALNVTLDSDYAEIQLKNLPIRGWTRTIFVPHPVYHLKSRVISRALQLDTYRPICALNSRIVSTFDNKTYAPYLDNSAWTVLLQYVPRNPSDANVQPQQPQAFLQSPQPAIEQLRQVSESYILLVHPQNNKQHEIRLMFASNRTGGKLVEILIQPSSSGVPKVLVQKKQVQFSENQAAVFYNASVQVYALPNNQVKLEIEDVFNLVCDSETVRIAALNSKFRDASRGLCGTFTGEPHTDFLTPSNTIVQDADQFVKSYSISADNMQPQQSVQQQSVSRSGEPIPQYGQKQQIRPNYISSANQDSFSHRFRSCVKSQTRFVEESTQICFTIKPLPVCKHGCRADGHISKKVPVHCVPYSPAAELWKNQILQGGSPNFREKEPTKSISMIVPRRCRA